MLESQTLLFYSLRIKLANDIYALLLTDTKSRHDYSSITNSTILYRDAVRCKNNFYLSDNFSNNLMLNLELSLNAAFVNITIPVLFFKFIIIVVENPSVPPEC